METTHLDSGIQLARAPRALYNSSAQFEAEVKRPLGDAEVAAAPNFFPRQIAPLTGRILRKVSGEVLQETLKKYEKLRILALRGAFGLPGRLWGSEPGHPKCLLQWTI